MNKLTPEGLVKRKVKAVLSEFDTVYWFMPVQMGYGAATLDFICLIKWFTISVAFFIETKAPGEVPTDRQQVLIDDLRNNYNAKVFVIDGESGLEELRSWLMERQSEHTHADLPVS